MEILKAELRIIRYGILIGALGGIAPYIGPSHSPEIKTLIGIVVGCMILGKKLPDAVRQLFLAIAKRFE